MQIMNIEEHKEKIFDFFAEGAKRCDKINYHIAKLPRYHDLRLTSFHTFFYNNFDNHLK